MLSNIEIVRESDDKLRRQVWRFWYYDSRHALILDSYKQESRESLRKKVFKASATYFRIQSRDSNIDELAVPMPEDVVAEAIAKFNASLRVCRWSDVR